MGWRRGARASSVHSRRSHSAGRAATASSPAAHPTRRASSTWAPRSSVRRLPTPTAGRRFRSTSVRAAGRRWGWARCSTAPRTPSTSVASTASPRSTRTSRTACTPRPTATACAPTTRGSARGAPSTETRSSLSIDSSHARRRRRSCSSSSCRSSSSRETGARRRCLSTWWSASTCRTARGRCRGASGIHTLAPTATTSRTCCRSTPHGPRTRPRSPGRAPPAACTCRRTLSRATPVA